MPAEHAARAGRHRASARVRWSISRAARRVNVSSRIRSGATPSLDQPGDARAQRRRLAGSGAGEDQQRAARVGGGRALLGVELVEPRPLRAGGRGRSGPLERQSESG